jgi:hypothetical protein
MKGEGLGVRSLQLRPYDRCMPPYSLIYCPHVKVNEAFKWYICSLPPAGKCENADVRLRADMDIGT